MFTTKPIYISYSFKLRQIGQKVNYSSITCEPKKILNNQDRHVLCIFDNTLCADGLSCLENTVYCFKKVGQFITASKII